MSVPADRKDASRPGGGGSASQYLLISLFGLYGRSAGAALPVAGLITVMGDLGVGAPAARSAISRLKKRGLIEPASETGVSAYAAAEGMEETFREGDERIFHARRAEIGDRWVLAVFTVPESQRNLRHQIRSGLSHLGFGTVAPGIWIAPEHLQSAAQRYMERQGLSEYIDWFAGDYLGSRDGKAAVAQWWDLDGLARQYEEFVAQYDHLRATPEDDPQQAFAAYIPMITQWRRLPYLDPGLPLELLPEDWPGVTAQQLFDELHGRLSGPAAKHVKARLAGE